MVIRRSSLLRRFIISSIYSRGGGRRERKSIFMFERMRASRSNFPRNSRRGEKGGDRIPVETVNILESEIMGEK